MDLKKLTIKGLSPHEFEEMIDHFQTTAPESFGKSHYDLSSETGIAANLWSKFINDPKIQTFIQDELTELGRASTREAKLNIGEASSSVEIARTKQLLLMQEANKAALTKPFNIYAFPSEVKKYKDALLRIKEVTTNEIVKNIIKEVIPNST